MIGQVADVLIMFEADGKGQSVESCFPFTSSRTVVVSSGDKEGTEDDVQSDMCKMLMRITTSI